MGHDSVLGEAMRDLHGYNPLDTETPVGQPVPVKQHNQEKEVPVTETNSNTEATDVVNEVLPCGHTRVDHLIEHVNAVVGLQSLFGQLLSEDGQVPDEEVTRVTALLGYFTGVQIPPAPGKLLAEFAITSTSLAYPEASAEERTRFIATAMVTSQADEIRAAEAAEAAQESIQDTDF